MKPRVFVLLGRIGSILLATGLALGLVCVIPATSGPTIEPRWTSRPMTWTPYSHPQYSPSNPQKGVRISVTSNSSLQIYVLGTHSLQLREWALSWVKEHFPSLNASQAYWATLDMSVLEAYLQTHPENVMLNEGVKGEWSFEFFPPNVTNVTIVVSNPSLAPTSVDMKTTPIATLVPRQRAVTITEVLFATGIVLALPRIVQKSKNRARPL